MPRCSLRRELAGWRDGGPTILRTPRTHENKAGADEEVRLDPLLEEHVSEHNRHEWD
jgi:hypothetical protein